MYYSRNLPICKEESSVFLQRASALTGIGRFIPENEIVDVPWFFPLLPPVVHICRPLPADFPILCQQMVKNAPITPVKICLHLFLLTSALLFDTILPKGDSHRLPPHLYRKE